MTNEAPTIYQRLKQACIYTTLGVGLFYGLATQGTLTGHPSADLTTGRTQLTPLEKAIYAPLSEKLNIESNKTK